VLELMARWDGHYAAARQEPVAFELFHVRFRRSYYVHRYGAAAADSLFAIAAMGRLLLDDLPRIPDHALAGLLRDALAEAGRTLGRFRNWGEMHRLALAHPLAFVPGLGKRYRFGDMPTGGSTESLMKTAHDGSDTRHVTRYGQQARFVADLADLDANHFLLLGGQDGWIGSTTALDQIPLWRGGGYIRMPLRLETVRAGFPHRMVLAPQR
jgi:penicillin amidase